MVETQGLDRAVDLVTAAVTVALLVVVGLGVAGLPRILLALVFVTFAPGWAVLGQSKLVQGTSRYAMAVAVSLTICTAAALAMAWLRTWDPVVGFYGLGSATVFAISWRSARRHPPTTLAPVVALPAVVTAPPTVAEEPPAVLEDPQAPVPAPLQPGAHLVEQRRPALRTENLRLTSVGVHAVYLRGPAFAPHELTDFFAFVQERHPFATFRLEADGGAVMETAGSRRLRITRDSIDYSQPQPADFGQARHNVVDLLGEVQQRLAVGFLANPSFRLQVRVVASPELAHPSRLGAQVLGLCLGSRLDRLGGTNGVGVGLHLTGESDAPRHRWTVALQPETNGSLLVEATTNFCLTAEDGKAIGERLQESHRFLTDTVAPFVDSLIDAAPSD